MSASAGADRRGARRALAAISARLPFLVEIYRTLHNPKWQLAIARDLVRTWRDGRRFRAALPLAGSQTALVALYRDSIYETKLGLVLGASLRTQGVQPVVAIMSKRDSRISAYARCFGVRRVVDRAAFGRRPIDDDVVEQAVAEVLALPPTFDALKAWRFQGHAAGFHVLSTVIRVTLDGAIDLAHPDAREVLRSVCADVVRNYLVAEQVLDEVDPVVVLLEEANYGVNGPLVDVAVTRGIDVVQTIGIWRDDALMSKRITAATRRVDAKSVAADTFAALAASPLTSAEETALDHDTDLRYGGSWVLSRQFQPDNVDRTPVEITDELGLDPDKPTVVVFAHVLWDASLFFGDDLFDNYGDWLVETVRVAVDNPNLNWVIKAHPSNIFRSKHGDVGGEAGEVVLLRERFPELPAHVQVLPSETRISARSIYSFADVGVTVRGTPGLEMAYFGKSVLTAGTGNYSGLGFTIDSDSRAQYLDRLASLHELAAPTPASVERARRYAHTLFLVRPWKPRTFALEWDFLDVGWHPLDRNIAIDPTTPGGIGDDLRRFATWAVHEDAADLLGATATPVPPVPARPGTAQGSGPSRSPRAVVQATSKRVARTVDRLRPSPDGLVVLLYHQVGGPRPSGVNIAPDVFAEQMAELAATERLLTLDAGVDSVLPGGSVGAPTGGGGIAVTFDDGTVDLIENALPILVDHGVPITLYLATKWVEEGRSFWDDGTVLSWAALADALSTGLVTIGSHTHSHALLDRLDPGAIADELDRSIGLIEDRLGVTPSHFAYPKALSPSAAADRAVRERFRSAALAGTRPNPPGHTDPYRLARSPIQVADGLEWFRHKATGGMWLEDRARDLVNRRRYVGRET